MRDIEGETTGLTDIGIAQMQAMKTGALIRAAIRMGAILGGADNEALGHVTAYAEAAGRAFQLADDLLDVTASPEKMGKATGKDATKGKQTLVAKIGVEAAQPPPRRHRPRRDHRAHALRSRSRHAAPGRPLFRHQRKLE